ncbi:hypothetical protein AZE42_05223 [Rhizopogon vesiculosus]|uniref:Cytochrome P450 n=1 Tax=Rhizopogon vesiculosus TaxID=180088 RepID=A0A1J8QX38_9AGAM|nr:hypothetical protein AZE42_05223 [Rhizopogon vesiculosus]
MAQDLIGWGNDLILQQYGERFRQIRRMIHKLFGSPSSVKAFHPIQKYVTLRFVQNVLNKPEELAAHVRNAIGATILKILHGYDVQEGNDPLVELTDKAMAQFSEVTTPGAYLVNTIPILKYLPSWFPGASFQKTALLYRQTLRDFLETPYNMVLEQMVNIYEA